MNTHATRLVLITAEDWAERVESMDETGDHEKSTIRELEECISKCETEEFNADIRGNGFEEQMEDYKDKETAAEKPKNMCLNCFKNLPEEKWKITKSTATSTVALTGAKTTDGDATTLESTTTEITVNTNAPTTVTATTASGAVTVTGDSRKTSLINK